MGIMDRTINYTPNKKITDFKPGDTLYISKMSGGYQFWFLCEFIRLKGNKIIAKILDGDPDWSMSLFEFNKGTEILSIPQKTYLWGNDGKLKWNHCIWYNKEKGIYE